MTGPEEVELPDDEHRRLLGRAIREIRARRDISQEELGFRSGKHRNYVGALERGEVNATFRTLLTVTHGLDVPLSMLIRLYERGRAEKEAKAALERRIDCTMREEA